MKQRSYFFLALLCLASFRSLAQFGSDTLLAKDNVLIPLPMVSINFGIGHLMSDVKLNSGPSAFKQFGYQLTVTQTVTKFLNASFELYGGTVYGEEQRELTNLNFKTSLFSQRLSVEYNFYPLLKPNARGVQTIRPYLGFGVGLLSFRSKGDLRSSNGSSYNYWSNGSIYAETEGSLDVAEATLIERDFVYESDLRDANLDGLRKYSQLAFSLPINAGIRFQVTKNIGLNAAFAYALNFSDMLDNVSSAGVGNRLGKAGNDNHLFGSLGLTVYLGTTKPSAKPKKATPEALAAAAKAKADAKRAEQKAVKEQAAEASKLAAESESDQKAETASGDALNGTDNQTDGMAISDSGSANENRISETNVKDVTARSDQNVETALGNGLVKTDNQVDRVAIIKSDSTSENKPKEATINNSERSIEVAASDEKKPIDAKEGPAKTELGAKKSDSDEVITKTNAAGTEGLPSTVSETASDSNSTVSFSGKGKRKNKSKSEETRLLVSDATSEVKIDSNSQAENIDGTTSNSSIPPSGVESESRNVIDSESDPGSETDMADHSSKNPQLKSDDNKIMSNSENETSGKLDTLTEVSSYKTTPSANSRGKSTSGQKPSDSTVEKQSDEMKSSISAINQGADQPNSDNSKAKESSATVSIEKIENSAPKKTGSFHWADLNDDGMISPTEVLHFIDLLFEGESARTVEDIQFLIDYYFDQE